MEVPKIHFLNVKQGDCFLLEHPSGRLTMIDICCGNLTRARQLIEAMEAMKEEKPRGNYGMCRKPTNPIDYMEKKGFYSIWRFILTHPDMDHMDGIRKLFNRIEVSNFWDCGIRREKPDFEEGGPYLEEDWKFYEKLINDEVDGTKIISPRAGNKGKYWNEDDKGGNGDHLYIVSPSNELVKIANNNGDIHSASYVIVYRSSAGSIIFSGDSNDKTWEYILANYKNLVENAAVLFAPHHGRKSNRDYSFLDILNPRISFFGCARSDHLAYSAWQHRDLLYFTNNQCGNVHIYPTRDGVEIFIENYTYARNYTNENTYKKDDYWFLCKK